MCCQMCTGSNPAFIFKLTFQFKTPQTYMKITSL